LTPRFCKKTRLPNYTPHGEQISRYNPQVPHHLAMASLNLALIWTQEACPIVYLESAWWYSSIWGQSASRCGMKPRDLDRLIRFHSELDKRKRMGFCYQRSRMAAYTHWVFAPSARPNRGFVAVPILAEGPWWVPPYNLHTTLFYNFFLPN